MRRAIIGFTLIFSLVFVLDLYPGLRGGGGWQWPLLRPQHITPVLILAGLLLVYVTGAVAIRRAAHAVSWAVLGGVALALAVTSIQGDPFFHVFTRTVSPVQTGASALAVRIMARDGLHATLARWPEVMREALDLNLIHFTTSPPGQPLVHHALAKAFDAVPIAQGISLPLRLYQCADVQVMKYTRGELVSAGVGMLMPLWAALAVIPLYFVLRDLSGSPDVARRGVLWFPLVPSVLLFAPVWNTLYPLLVVLAFALLVRGLMRRRMAGVLLAGGVMSVMTFLNFAALPVLLLFGVFTLGYWYFVARAENDHPAFLWTVRAGVWFGLGLLSVWAVFFAASGVSPLDILRVTFTSHSALVQRNDLEWLLLHPYDVALFMGLPLAALAVWGMVMASRRAAPTALDIAAISTALMIIGVNLVGLVQGENGRILAYYAPFLIIAAARLLERQHVGLLGTQAVMVLVMAATLHTVPLDLNPQQFTPRDDIAALGDALPFIPADARFTSAAYSGAFTLGSYRFVADPSAQAITFEFAWEGQVPTERPYQFEMIARAENEIDGEIAAPPFIWTAQGGSYPPTCWRAGQRVRDTVVLPLPPVSMPVIWDVELRARDARTGDVMQTSAPVVLGPVRYP